MKNNYWKETATKVQQKLQKLCKKFAKTLQKKCNKKRISFCRFGGMNGICDY